jgi:homopolymeric O-antigen transport system ATP-binding protein
MQPIISARNVSKQYRLGAAGIRYATLRAAIAGTLSAPLRLLSGRNGGAKREMIWALDDVSFDVRQGEALGIIGRNGAGKSTLLKVLSRITKPTRGTVDLYGRVGSLLEVGTGFHPELTGRENIFLNGAILGMTREEIARKFDEIVAFAEIEKFLDTPVKHFSSGMYVRLAFAVAAHLEPEILIVDEVLSVGDAAFQKKCLGKMNEVAHTGRTVLFVSHDLNAVNSLCERAILLHDGRVLRDGPPRDVTAYYLDRANKIYTPVTWFTLAGVGDEVRLLAASAEQRGESLGAVSCREPFSVALDYEITRSLRGLRLFIIVRNERGEIVFMTSDFDEPAEVAFTRDAGRFKSRVTVPGGLLKAGGYYVTFGADVKNERIVYTADDALHFDVFDTEEDLQGDRHSRVGLVAPLLRWETERAADEARPNGRETV